MISTDEPPEATGATKPADDTGDVLFKQMMDLFVVPAARERQLRGELPTPVVMSAAQIIFFPDGRKPLVRLNDEVQGRVTFRAKRPIAKGEVIYDRDVGAIEGVELIEDDEDCGHVTIIRTADQWQIRFDFHYNKRSKATLARAKEFHAVAQVALEKGHLGPCVDNLYSAAELSAKALLMAPHPKLRKVKTHEPIRAKFNEYARIGKVHASQRKAFNSLDDLRRRGRYLQGELALTMPEARALIADIAALIEHVDRALQTIPRDAS